MQHLIKELAHFGLSADEAKAYLASLELGPATILEISRKTGLNRTTLYAIVHQLVEKRFIATAPHGKRILFTAESPEKLEVFFKERLAMFSDVLPELISLSKNGIVKPKMRYYDGLEGIKTIYRNSVKSIDPVLYSFCGIERLSTRSKELIVFWEKEYIPAREKSGHFGRLIIPDNAEGRAWKAKDAVSNRECRLVPASQYNFEGEVLLYDDTVAFISYTEDEEFALSLESKAIAKTLKMIWQIVWNAGY